MDISIMKARKKELKMTLDEISERSGIPKRTLEDIFRGATKNPRIDTMEAIERALGLNPSTEWTSEDTALGIQHNPKQVLSPDETELLNLYRAVKEEKGEAVAHAVKTLLKNFLEDK